MWFPTHIRRDGASRIFLALTFICVTSTGCSSLPVLHAPAQSNNGPSLSNNGLAANEQPDNRTAASIPVPEFQERSSDLLHSTSPSITAPRVAGNETGRGLISAPKPFAWEPLSTSAGERTIDGITVGQSGYRTLIIGSLAGDDPLAVLMAETLAKHVHENGIILGGIEATVLRNVNPDGEALFRMENGNGVYLNREFTDGADASENLKTAQPEVRFLIGLLQDRQPQRIIHLRTVSGPNGLVASNAGARVSAKEVADWLGFRFVDLPGESAKGTLERFVATKNTCDIVTFAIPTEASRNDVWDLYGGALLNLLLSDDYQTRKLARETSGPVSADRRHKKQNRIPSDSDTDQE